MGTLDGQRQNQYGHERQHSTDGQTWGASVDNGQHEDDEAGGDARGQEEIKEDVLDAEIVNGRIRQLNINRKHSTVCVSANV